MKDLRRAIAVVAMVSLLATAFSGCLGGEELVTRPASELVITALEIPGNWTLTSSNDYPTPTGNTSNGASRMYQNVFLEETRIVIFLLAFISIENAKAALVNESSSINYSLQQGAKYLSPGIEDESHW